MYKVDEWLVEYLYIQFTIPPDLSNVVLFYKGRFELVDYANMLNNLRKLFKSKIKVRGNI